MNNITPPILIGIGANLKTPEYGSPRLTCEAAIDEMEKAGLTITRRSNWFKSAPVPISDQPWYINGLIAVETALGPLELIALLHGVEKHFGRVRGEKNAPRTLDLDLIAYGDKIIGRQGGDEPGLTVPHPRLESRAFVLLPLREIAPGWRHPALGLSLDAMIVGLDPAQQTMPDDPGRR